MSKSINEVRLLGRLGQDPDLKYSPSNMAVTKFSVATNHPVKKGGKWEDSDPDWERVTVFSGLAEACSRYLHKGSNVYVEGRMQTRAWEDNDGNKRWSTEVIASNVVFLDPKSSESHSQTRNQGPQDPPEEYFDDDVPF